MPRLPDAKTIIAESFGTSRKGKRMECMKLAPHVAYEVSRGASNEFFVRVGEVVMDEDHRIIKANQVVNETHKDFLYAFSKVATLKDRYKNP